MRSNLLPKHTEHDAEGQIHFKVFCVLDKHLCPFFMRFFILLFLFPGCFHVPRNPSLLCETGFKIARHNFFFLRLNKHRANFKTQTHRGQAIYLIWDCLICFLCPRPQNEMLTNELYLHQLSGGFKILAGNRMNYIKRRQSHRLWSVINANIWISKMCWALRIAKALVYYLLRINHVSCLLGPGESQQQLCLFVPDGSNPARVGTCI